MRAFPKLTCVQMMNASEITEAILPAFPESIETLKIVLVYEDFEMGTRGKDIFDLIAKEAGGAGAAQLTVWRFDFFQSAELTQAVTRQTEVADVIIVAPRDPNNLPARMKSWIEEWPQRRKTGAGALVAVFHPEAGTHAKSSDAALLLWRAAGRAGMDFFCHKANTVASKPSVDFPANTTMRTVTAAPLAPATVNFNTYKLSEPHNTWGINE